MGRCDIAIKGVYIVKSYTLGMRYYVWIQFVAKFYQNKVTMYILLRLLLWYLAPLEYFSNIVSVNLWVEETGENHRPAVNH